MTCSGCNSSPSAFNFARIAERGLLAVFRHNPVRDFFLDQSRERFRCTRDKFTPFDDSAIQINQKTADSLG
jgi:hypothetical protein